MGEHVETVFTNLVSVVPVLKHRLWIEVAPYIIEVAHELMIRFFGFEFLRHLGQ